MGFVPLRHNALWKPPKKNTSICKSCGAVVTEDKCEYCGSEVKDDQAVSLKDISGRNDMAELKQFYCLKCGSLVELLYFTRMTSKSEEFFNELNRVSLCKKCHAKPVKFEQVFIN